MKFSLKAFFVLGALIFIYHSVVKQIFSFIHLKYRKSKLISIRADFLVIHIAHMMCDVCLHTNDTPF